MLHPMDQRTQGVSKKKIKVRKPHLSPNASSTSNISYENDYYIPIAANDSQWNGIKFTIPKDENVQHTDFFTDEESEIRVIDLDIQAEDSPPLLLLFPELKNDQSNIQNVLDKQVSTTDVTKMLVGKKPNLALLKPCRRINSKRVKLSPVEEISESDESIKQKRTKVKKHVENHRRYSTDADIDSN